MKMFEVTEDKISIPSECGDFCPGKRSAEGHQGDSCHRCPIFNCIDTSEDKDDPYGGPLLQPEEYSKELLQKYLAWWDDDLGGITDERPI